ncbi:MAG: hypothetical protein E6212_08425 [Actinomyces sp.]|uniref:hypothetical protein n=1 Tax=Actinomyces sp. HPA0247 TaxID=1203556 RepID=UPI00039E507B|nr:hypothetical protein [Actinomyces sp. HPA0247]MBS6968346.1 hypothetical protein [Actinomyces sp.]MDU5164556.1 hypothetical protein [Actinomyces sp.]
MPFPIDVDALFAFEEQCSLSAGALRRADGDAIQASSIITQQEALLVEDCRRDLQIMSNVCEEASNDLNTLKNAVSEFAWAMRSVRDEYLGIAQTARDCGLLVDGDTVILFDEDVEDCAHSFEELRAQAQVQRLNYERAEYVFSLALESLKVDAYEQWIEPVFNAFKDKFVPNEKHLLANGIACGVGIVDTIGQSTSALTMQHFDGLYKAPEGFLDKGDLSKWTFEPIGKHGLEPVGTRRVAPALGKVGKVAGVAGAVVDGGITAYDTYQTDTQQHPEWSEGHKVARAGVKGVTTGGTTFVMGIAGAKVGAAVGAVCSGPFAPVGAVVGGLIGGVVGGLAGHYGGEYLGDLINEQGTDRIAEAIG